MTLNSKTKKTIRDIVITLVGILVILAVLVVVFGTWNPVYVVSSGSMVPYLQVYDLIVVQGNDPFEEVEVGDVIVYNKPSGHDRVIVHRVVAITDDDPFTVRTQGDANPRSIPGTDFPITKEEYIGTVTYIIPEVGFISKVITTKIAGIPLNYIIIAIIIGIFVFKQMTKKKESGIHKDNSSELDKEQNKFDVPEDKEYSTKSSESEDGDDKTKKDEDDKTK